MSRPLSPALQKLMAQFGRQLPDKLAEIRTLHDAASANRDEAAMQAYYTAVHRIAGSSGSYGYREVSVTARELDRYLSDVIAGEQDYTTAQAETLLAAVDAAVAAVDTGD